MGWEPERNRFSLSPHGIKEAEGHGAHVDVSAGNEMPRAGVCGAPMNVDPHGRGDRASPYASPSARRPRDEPTEMKPPHSQGPHDHLDPRRR